MKTLIEKIYESRLLERSALAKARSAKVVEDLAARGVTARVIGSLATGKFALHSDVDFLIEECPKRLVYSIEADIESVMLDIPFDVLYQDEIAV